MVEKNSVFPRGSCRENRMHSQMGIRPDPADFLMFQTQRNSYNGMRSISAWKSQGSFSWLTIYNHVYVEKFTPKNCLEKPELDLYSWECS